MKVIAIYVILHVLAAVQSFRPNFANRLMIRTRKSISTTHSIQTALRSAVTETLADDGTAKPLLHAEGSDFPCRIKVIGVGGGGGNAVNRMMESATAIHGVEMWSVNTDAQALSKNQAPMKLNIGKITSRGLGAGGSADIGYRAAVESREEIMDMVKGADLVFVTAGMGGGTGSGAAPVIAECARESGALTVGVVTKPFAFEGRRRMQQANEAIEQLKDKVDTLIVVSNDKLLQIVPANTPVTDAFLVADDILRQGVVGISEIIIKPGLVNVDFADIRTVMSSAGTALLGIGVGTGETRAADAAMNAISSPLLDFPIDQAKGIVFNIVGGANMTLQEINSAAEVIYENVDPAANIIFGALVDDKITSGEVSITVLATGFENNYFHSRNGGGSGSSGSSGSGGGRGGGPSKLTQSTTPLLLDSTAIKLNSPAGRDIAALMQAQRVSPTSYASPFAVTPAMQQQQQQQQQGGSNRGASRPRVRTVGVGSGGDWMSGSGSNSNNRWGSRGEDSSSSSSSSSGGGDYGDGISGRRYGSGLWAYLKRWLRI